MKIDWKKIKRLLFGNQFTLDKFLLLTLIFIVAFLVIFIFFKVTLFHLLKYILSLALLIYLVMKYIDMNRRE